MSADRKDLDDQLNILFDDLPEEIKAEESSGRTSGIVASEKSPSEIKYAADSYASEGALNYIDLDAAESAAAARSSAERAPEELLAANGSAAAPHEPTAGKTDFPKADLGMDDFQELVLDRDNDTAGKENTGNAEKTLSVRNDLPDGNFFLDGDDYDEEAYYNNQEADEDEHAASSHRSAARPLRDGEPTSEELRREAVHFWIFTAVIAIIVAASVIVILNGRGYLELNFLKKQETTSAAPVTSSQSLTETESVSQNTAATEAESTVTEAESTSEESTSEEQTTAEESTVTEAESTTSEASSVLDHYTNLFVITNTPTVNLRASASADSAIIGTLNENAGGEVLEITGDWYHVKSGALEGYVNGSYVLTGAEAEAIAVAHAAKRVKVNARVNIRRAPDTSADVLDIAEEGAVYDYIDGESDGFFHIYYNESTEGYVSSDFAAVGYYIEEADIYYGE